MLTLLSNLERVRGVVASAHRGHMCRAGPETAQLYQDRVPRVVQVHYPQRHDQVDYLRMDR